MVPSSIIGSVGEMISSIREGNGFIGLGHPINNSARMDEKMSQLINLNTKTKPFVLGKQ